MKTWSIQSRVFGNTGFMLLLMFEAVTRRTLPYVCCVHAEPRAQLCRLLARSGGSCPCRAGAVFAPHWPSSSSKCWKMHQACSAGDHRSCRDPLGAGGRAILQGAGGGTERGGPWTPKSSRGPASPGVLPCPWLCRWDPVLPHRALLPSSPAASGDRTRPCEHPASLPPPGREGPLNSFQCSRPVIGK